MKKLVNIVFLTMIVSSSLLAQDKIWSFNLNFKGELSQDELKKTIPDFAISFYEPFVKGSNAFKDVSVLTSNTKIKSNINKVQVLISDRVKKQEFSYTIGDDMVTEDELSFDFPLKSDSTVDSYLILDESEEKELVAGVSCTKAKLKVVDSHSGEINLNIWYSKDIPSYYLEGLPFLINIPGAVIKYEDQKNPNLNFTASNLTELTSTKEFDLPQSMKVLNIAKSVETQSKEESNFFEDSFTLKSPLKWFSAINKDFGEEYLFGVKKDNGEVVYPATFYSIDVLNDTHAIVSDINNQFWIIDNSAKKINNAGFETLYAVNSENMVYAYEGQFGIINASGVSIIGGLTNISKFMGNYLLFSQQEKQGVIDFNGNIVLKPTLDFIDTDEEGNVLIKDSKQGNEIQKYSFSDFQQKYLNTKF